VVATDTHITNHNAERDCEAQRINSLSESGTLLNGTLTRRPPKKAAVACSRPAAPCGAYGDGALYVISVPASSPLRLASHPTRLSLCVVTMAAASQPGQPGRTG